MYIQENGAEKERGAPPDYRGHTYVAEAPPPASEQEVEESPPPVAEDEEEKEQKSAPAGAFSGGGNAQSGGKRGGFFENLGLGNLFSRVPFLSSLMPPPRKCAQGERKHGELWDWILIALVVLSFLNGKDDDVLPILLLLLLWD